MTVPRNTPPRRPSRSSRNSVGVDSIAYGPRIRGVVTARLACHHVASASGSKNARITTAGGTATNASRSRAVIPLIRRAGGRARVPLGAGAGDHLLHFTHQRGNVIGDALLDGPLDAAAVHVLHAIAGSNRGIVRPDAAVHRHDVRSVRVQHLQVL